MTYCSGHLEPGRLRLGHSAEPADPALGGRLLGRRGRLQELMAVLLLLLPRWLPLVAQPALVRQALQHVLGRDGRLHLGGLGGLLPSLGGPGGEAALPELGGRDHLDLCGSLGGLSAVPEGHEEVVPGLDGVHGRGGGGGRLHWGRVPGEGGADDISLGGNLNSDGINDSPVGCSMSDNYMEFGLV